MVARNFAGALPADAAGDVIARSQEQSVVQRLASRATLGGRGETVTVVTGDPEAQFVTEGAAKPVADPTATDKVLRPFTLAIIEPFTNQLRRDRGRLYQELVGRLPGALARGFDRAVCYGLNGAPGTDFDILGTNVASVNVNAAAPATPYKQVLGALSTIADTGAEPSGFALSPAGVYGLMGAVDADGRPLFLPNVIDSRGLGNILGIQTATSKALKSPTTPAGLANTLGFVGDWASARWGVVEDIQYSESSEATITYQGSPLNLWERNMFAVRVEVEIGFRYAAATDFVRLTSA